MQYAATRIIDDNVIGAVSIHIANRCQRHRLTVPAPSPGPHSCLLGPRPQPIGMCRTNLPIADGQVPFEACSFGRFDFKVIVVVTCRFTIEVSRQKRWGCLASLRTSNSLGRNPQNQSNLCLRLLLHSTSCQSVRPRARRLGQCEADFPFASARVSVEVDSERNAIVSRLSNRRPPIRRHFGH